jgi:MFS family permease
MTNKNPIAWVSATMVVALMGTALVSPLYPIYQKAWQLTSGEVTQLYVIYMAGALVSLLVFGRLADLVGFYRVLALSLVLSLVGTSLSLLAGGFYVFAVGRFLVGVAASLVTTGGLVALTTLTRPERRRKLALLSSLIISAGFALGPIAGGLLGQLASKPLVSAYVPSLILLVICMAGHIVAVPRPEQPLRLPNWRVFLPQLRWSDKADSRHFALTCCLPFISFGVFGLYASMAPLMIRDFIGLDGPVVSGAFIGLFLTCVAVTQFMARGLTPRVTGLVSLVMIVVGNLCMLVNLGIGSLWIFAGGVLVGAIGHGLSLLASIAVLVEVSRDENRGALTSTYWAIGYSGSIFPMLLLGWIADHWGLARAIFLFCTTIVIACAVVFILTAILGRRSSVKTG